LSVRERICFNSFDDEEDDYFDWQQDVTNSSDPYNFTQASKYSFRYTYEEKEYDSSRGLESPEKGGH
jgi:hypothetical protein